ncbi:MAG: hypothetical protein JXB88_23110 [Spirochaetales bacterium]|nr:hypothetical protein [Spirochaetales bacterium]
MSIKSFIILCLLFCTVPLSYGAEPGMNFLYNEDTGMSPSLHYSFILPDYICFFLNTLQGNIRMMPDSMHESSVLQMEFYNYSATRITRDRQALLKTVKFWSWMTLGSFGVNCGVVVLAFLANNPEIGALSMISHGLFGISNVLLGNAYYNLNRSLYAYGPEGKNTYIGMATAYGATVFAVIGIGIGATMFDHGPDMPAIIATATAAGISNLLGLSAFVYYLFFDKSI